MPRTKPFDKYGDRYDEWFEKNRDVYHSELETIRQLIPFPPANGLEVDEDGSLTGNGILRVELVNKRKALDDFLQRWGISRQRAAAVGNSFVDVSMFKGCSLSIAFNPIDAWVAENATTVVTGDDLREILPLLIE